MPFKRGLDAIFKVDRSQLELKYPMTGTDYYFGGFKSVFRCDFKSWLDLIVESDGNTRATQSRCSPFVLTRGKGKLNR